MEGMPSTKHEVQSFDCHPIPGRCDSSQYFDQDLAHLLVLLPTYYKGTTPPSLLVTVSGTVVHGKGPNANPAATPSKAIDGQPRVFTQTFMLTPDPDAPSADPTKASVVYYVNADAMRFVG